MAVRNSIENVVTQKDSLYPVREFTNEVTSVKTLSVDDRLRDLNLVYTTDIVEMTNDLRYLVSYNTIESAREIEKEPDSKQFPGSNILVLEGTAWVTKNGGFYKKRHDAQALQHHRSSMIVGVQQNLTRYNNLYKTTDDMLAIHAFYAATRGYDQENLTTIGTSRGGMLALLLQLRAWKYGKKVIHSDAMVPCIPTPADALKMISFKNLRSMLVNEKEAAANLGLTFEEVWEMRDTLDILTARGLVQQLKEGIALIGSDISRAVKKSPGTDDVGDITVQSGDGMSFAHKWPKIYRNHSNMNIDVREGGGHASSVGKQHYLDAMERQEAVASVLHTDPTARNLGGAALRQLIDGRLFQALRATG